MSDVDGVCALMLGVGIGNLVGNLLAILLMEWASRRGWI